MWLHDKELADNTGNYKLYKGFLQELKKQFSKLYLEMENKAWMDFLQNILDEVNSELRRIALAEKKEKLPF